MPVSYIISDLHLSAQRPQTAALFFRFLKEITTKADRLYILGDFFDYWIGDDDWSDFNRQIIDRLRQAADDGLHIYFMAGNRDFLIGQRFCATAGIHLINEPYLLSYRRSTIVLMHGDLLCGDDKSYLRFRRCVRSRLIQTLYLMLPLRLRRRLAEKIRHQSREKNSQYPDIDVTKERIAYYRQSAPYLIHGHTHKFAVHEESDYTRYVLGDWHENEGSYIKIDHTIELKHYF
ncbi:MAG: UDP-2,3-diacylglucosamine diphosphatase [Francisellaceae bacterium]